MPVPQPKATKTKTMQSNSATPNDDNNNNILDLQDIEASLPKQLNSGEKYLLTNDAKDDNLPSPPNYSKFSPSHIAYAFNKYHDSLKHSLPSTTLAVSQKSLLILKQITMQLLNKVSQSSIISPQILLGITPLALMNDAEIPKELLRILVEKVKTEAFLDVTKLQAISLVVAYGGSKLDPNFIFESLSLISKKFSSIRVKDDTAIHRCLRCVNELLDGLMTMDVMGVVEVGTVKEIFDSFDHLRSTSSQGSSTSVNITSTNRLIEVELNYAHQSLMRITSQKTDFEKLFTTSFSLVKGVVKASCAIVNRDPMALIEAVIDTYQDGSKLVSMFKDKRKEEWFSHLRTVKVLCASDFGKFRTYYTELFLRLSEVENSKGRYARVISSMTSSSASKHELLLGIVSLLNQVVCNQELLEEMLYYDEMEGESMKSVREIAIYELGSIYLQPSVYGEDFGVRSVIVDYLWQYCSIPEDALQATSKGTLVSILRKVDLEMAMRSNNAASGPQSSNLSSLGNIFPGRKSDSKNAHPSHPRRIWFNEINIRSRDPDSSHFPYARCISYSSSSCVDVTRYAMEMTCPLLYLIEQMRHRFHELCQPTDSSSSALQSDLDLYVPLNCSVGPTGKDEFDLFQAADDFLSPTSTQRVLLLHGDAGSGKSLFGRWLVSRLWERFSQGDEASVIPIFVSLPALKDPIRGVIEESLINHGFSRSQVNELRNSESHRRILFILDGFDEIQGRRNLYEGNGFGEWRNAKVLITARSEYLFGLGNYLSYFGSTSNLREYYICPFNVSQRKSFIDNYVRVGRSVWRESSRYEMCFNEVEGLTDLVTTPYLLRMATEILPRFFDAVGGSQKVKKKLTRFLLFEIFVEQEFLKRRDELRQRSTLKERGYILPEDFDELMSFLKLSMHLAALMYVHRVNSVTTRGRDYRLPDEKNDIWDEFFCSSDPTVSSSLFGVPLSIVGRQRSFRHKSLLEYFAALMLLRELSLLKKEGDNSQKSVSESLSTLSCDSYWNRRYLFEESSIRDFLVEMIDSSTSQDDHDDWNDVLLGIIESSRIDESLSTACGNSITLLIKLGHSFVGSDLSKIHCSGAVFDNADFRNVNFKGSVFQDCSWDGCCLDGCDFEDCDFTNSNLIEERSSLRDSSQIKNLLNLNKKDVVISTTSESTSIWSEGSIVNRLSEMKNCDLYCSPNEKWLLVSGGGQGYLFQTDNLKEVYWKLVDLHCVRDAIALTDDALCYGVKSDRQDVILFSLSLPKNPSVKNLSKKLKVNHERMSNLMGLEVIEPSRLFVFWKNIQNFSNCSYYQLNSETSQFQHLSSIRLIINRFERLPLSPYLFCWSTNRVPFILHLTSSTINCCEIVLPFSLQANDCCVSPDGSSMLLSSTSDGYLFSLMHESEAQHFSSSLALTKRLEVPGMTGPFSPSQFSSDGQLVSLVCDSEIRVIRVKGCVCLQVISMNFRLERVSFNQGDRELLMMKKYSDTIIRRRVDIKEELDSVSHSGKEISCLGSTFFGAKGLSSEDQSLFMERGGLFIRESDLISQYEACGDSDDADDLRCSLLREGLRSQYKGFICSSSTKGKFHQSLFSEVIASEYFDGSYADYLLFLKSEGFSFAERNENGETLLMTLSRIGHVKTITRISSEWELSVNEVKDKGESALLVACRYGNASVCKLLLSHGAQVNQAMDNGATPLHVASLNGHVSVCEILLSRGGAVNQADNDGATPLCVASQEGHASVCELLLNHGAEVNQARIDGVTSLYVASENGHVSVCALLLVHGAQVNQTRSDGASPLLVASRGGHASVCGLLLSHGAQVNQTRSDGFTPLYVASLYGHVSVCEMLLTSRAEVNQAKNNGVTPLFIASQKGFGSLCELLLSHGAQVNQVNNNRTAPLYVASENGHASVCEFLLSHGAQVDLANKNGATPLYIASLYGYVSVCDVLLNHGAQVNQAKTNGATPLYTASQNGHASVCDVLLSRGAEVNQADNDGTTPLFIASENGHVSVCDVLLRNGAAVNQADIDGRSPLYISSCCGHASVCDLLLSCGADLNQTVNGMNSLSIAFQQGHGSVCDLLLSHGAGGPTCQE